jgi:hypothetical protein
LHVDEIAADDLGSRLQLPVNTTVALFKTRRIPGQVEMNEIKAARLQIDALSGSVGA